LTNNLESLYLQDAGASDFVNPLTDIADFIDGQLWVAGNRMLINLNLSSKLCFYGYSLYENTI